TVTPGNLEADVLNVLGSGWSIAANADINNDGQTEIVAYRTADVPRSSIFDNPIYANYTRIVSELVIAQAGPNNFPLFLLRITPQAGIENQHGVLASFINANDPERMPAAFLLELLQDPGRTVAVIPLMADGTAYGQGAAVGWDATQPAYVLVGAVNPPAPVAPTAVPTAVLEDPYTLPEPTIIPTPTPEPVVQPTATPAGADEATPTPEALVKPTQTPIAGD
ncbi:MAG: hypothetical protein HC837_15410, partial [Chloroflexaceae bacterium]|nr:hypothetical protein [Chloroflexaceae bacterium]